MSEAVVVTQLTQRSLPVPDDPGSNPLIGNFHLTYLLLIVWRKDENKDKEDVNGPFKKSNPLKEVGFELQF